MDLRSLLVELVDRAGLGAWLCPCIKFDNLLWMVGFGLSLSIDVNAWVTIGIDTARWFIAFKTLAFNIIPKMKLLHLPYDSPWKTP